MKPISNPFLSLTAVATVTACVFCSSDAAQINWVGDTDNEFLNGANWAGDPNLPSTSADTWQVNGPGPQGNNTLNIAGGGLTFSGVGGKIAFGSGSGDMTLSGGNITLFQGTGGDIFRTDSTGVTTVAGNIILGDGTDATTTTVTYPLSSTSTTTGLLGITGNISGGAKAGTVQVSFGSTDGIDGNYEVSGNITRGNASAINVVKRGTGTLSLSGGNSFGSLIWNTEAASTAVVRITGGTTDVGSIKGSGLATQTLRVSGGTTNVTLDARQIRTSIVVDGGVLNIAGGDRISFNNSGQTFTMSSGSVNFNLTSGFGVRLGGDSGPANASGYGFVGEQTGGTFTVNGTGSQESTFSLGSAAASITTSHTQTGGVLDIKGSNSTNGWLTIGADSLATSSTTFTLSGGRLLVRSNPGSAGINGRNVEGRQVFNVTGGTLVAGHINATNLRALGNLSNGVFTNNGGNLAPGDIGITGKTTVTGDYAVSSGTLSIDLAGLDPSTSFQDASLTGKFDQLAITGSLALGGLLGLNLVDSYVPAFTDVFRIVDLTGAGALSGFFSNVNNGSTLLTAGGEGTFRVFSSGNDVLLSDFTVVPEPGAAALLGGFGVFILLRRRRD